MAAGAAEGVTGGKVMPDQWASALRVNLPSEYRTPAGGGHMTSYRAMGLTNGVRESKIISEY